MDLVDASDTMPPQKRAGNHRLARPRPAWSRRSSARPSRGTSALLPGFGPLADEYTRRRHTSTGGVRDWRLARWQAPASSIRAPTTTVQNLGNALVLGPPSAVPYASCATATTRRQGKGARSILFLGFSAEDGAHWFAGSCTPRSRPPKTRRHAQDTHQAVEGPLAGDRRHRHAEGLADIVLNFDSPSRQDARYSQLGQ